MQMSYKVTTGYRKPVFVFATDSEAKRFNQEYFSKTKVKGAISQSSQKATYVYSDDCKLIPV